MGSKRIIVVDLLFEVASQEILRKADRMAQTLQRAAEVARVIQVADTSESQSRILIRFAWLIPFLNDFYALALLLVEAQITNLTLFAAIVDFVALAIEGKLASFETEAALVVDRQW